VIEEQLDSGALELVYGPVGQRSPVGYLTGEEVREAANGEVRIAVGERDGDFN
jgi:hypothetical protein